MQTFQKLHWGKILRFSHGKAIQARETGLYPVYGSNGVIGRADSWKHQDAIVLGRVGAYCGSVKREVGRFWASDNTIVVKACDGHDLDFVYYLLVAYPLNELAGGSAQPLINQTILSRITTPIPDLQTQKKIASILSAYDDLIENNKRRIAILEKMAEEIYREWFVRMRFPGHVSSKVSKGLPAGWQILPLSSLAKEMRTGVKRKDLSESELYVGLEHIPRKSVLLDQWSTVASVDSDKLRFVEGDILFGKIRPYLHKIVLSHVTGACSTDTIVLRPIKKDYTGLLLFTVFSDTFVDLATTASKGTKMPRADWAFLKKLEIKVPSDSLLRQFSSIFETLFAEMVTLAKMNGNLLKSRDLLLPRLISGKLSLEGLDLPSNDSASSISSALPQAELAHA